MGNLSCGNLFPPFQRRSLSPLVCPARFVKMSLESDSGDADHHSGISRFLIGINPEQ
jgi:hypothetical protein